MRSALAPAAAAATVVPLERNCSTARETCWLTACASSATAPILATRLAAAARTEEPRSRKILCPTVVSMPASAAWGWSNDRGDRCSAAASFAKPDRAEAARDLVGETCPVVAELSGEAVIGHVAREPERRVEALGLLPILGERIGDAEILRGPIGRGGELVLEDVAQFLHRIGHGTARLRFPFDALVETFANLPKLGVANLLAGEIVEKWFEALGHRLADVSRLRAIQSRLNDLIPRPLDEVGPIDQVPLARSDGRRVKVLHHVPDFRARFRHVAIDTLRHLLDIPPGLNVPAGEQVLADFLGAARSSFCLLRPALQTACRLEGSLLRELLHRIADVRHHRLRGVLDEL